MPMAHAFALVRRHARHTDRSADQRANDQVVRRPSWTRAMRPGSCRGGKRVCTEPGRPWPPMNGLPVGSQTAAGRSRGCRIIPKTRSSNSLDALGIPAELLQDYLSLQLTALPGWAGFIKWRGEERDYPWQQAYPAGLVKFLAIRLWYARELVPKACQRRTRYRGAIRGRDGLHARLSRRILSATAAGGRPVARPLCRGSRSALASAKGKAGTMCLRGTVPKSFHGCKRRRGARRRRRLLALARFIEH